MGDKTTYETILLGRTCYNFSLLFYINSGFCLIKFKILLLLNKSLSKNFNVGLCKSPCFINSGNKEIIALYTPDIVQIYRHYYHKIPYYTISYQKFGYSIIQHHIVRYNTKYD